MKPVLFHSRAVAELDRAIAYYESQRAGLGKELQADIEQAVGRIQRDPLFWPRYKMTEYRHYVMLRFPYIMFYLELDDALWISAIAHGKRRPDYWFRRRIG